MEIFPKARGLRCFFAFALMLLWFPPVGGGAGRLPADGGGGRPDGGGGGFGLLL